MSSYLDILYMYQYMEYKNHMMLDIVVIYIALSYLENISKYIQLIYLQALIY